MTEADIPASVMAELDPSLELILIDTEAEDWQVADGPPPSQKLSATAPFNKNHLNRFGNSKSVIDDSRITHGEPIAPEARGPMQDKGNLPTERALDPSPANLATSGVVFGETAQGPRLGMAKKTDLPTEHAVDPGQPSLATSGVVFGGTAEGPRPGMAKKSDLPTLNHSDDFTATGNNVDASAVCECVGDDCVSKWVNNNVGCDVCVVFSCSDGSFPSSCVTCQ